MFLIPYRLQKYDYYLLSFMFCHKNGVTGKEIKTICEVKWTIKKISFIHKEGEPEVRCKTCNAVFSIAHSEKNDVERHLITHINAVKAVGKSKSSISSFFRKEILVNKEILKKWKVPNGRLASVPI